MNLERGEFVEFVVGPNSNIWENRQVAWGFAYMGVWVNLRWPLKWRVGDTRINQLSFVGGLFSRRLGLCIPESFNKSLLFGGHILLIRISPKFFLCFGIQLFSCFAIHVFRPLGAVIHKGVLN